jgi:hypothetical protein
LVEREADAARMREVVRYAFGTYAVESESSA